MKVTVVVGCRGNPGAKVTQVGYPSQRVTLALAYFFFFRTACLLDR